MIILQICEQLCVMLWWVYELKEKYDPILPPSIKNEVREENQIQTVYQRFNYNRYSLKALKYRIVPPTDYFEIDVFVQ